MERKDQTYSIYAEHANAIKHAYEELATLCAIDIYDIATIFDVVAKGWGGQIYEWMKEQMMHKHQLVLTKSQWFAFLGSSSIMDTMHPRGIPKNKKQLLQCTC